LNEVRSDVFACTRREKGYRLAEIPDSQVVATDLNDTASVRNMVTSISPQTVFHCAAYGAYSFEQEPGLIYRTNFQSVVNLVGELARVGLAAFVHAGSSSEYGTRCSGPHESDVCLPNSDYAVSKVAAADYLYYMGKQRAFPAVNLRIYSAYGPLEDTSRLIPNLLRHAVSGGYPPLVDATTSRDFIHVSDVCSAFILSASKMNPGLYGESFNIGTGQCTTIKDLALIAQSVFSIAQAPVFGSMQGRSWDLSNWYANPEKAERVLGWKAKIQLEKGLEQTAAWVSSLTEEQMVTASKRHPAARRRSISAIIACYKDEPAVPIMYERLCSVFKKIDVDYEIIFVNDASPDACAEVIRQISARDHRVVGITHSRNFGSQMAFRSGMELCTKDSVVLLDGDLQDPPELIESFFQRWQDGFDVVYGRRVKRDMPWYWAFQYKLFYRIFAAFSYIKIPRDAGDFSLMDRRVVGWLLKCPEGDVFMRGLRAYVGFKQTGVDYVRPDRMFGQSTNNLFKNIDWAKKGIFSFSNTPLTILTATGVVALGLSIFAAVVVAVLRLLVPDIAPRGVTTLLITILMFGSANLFAVGVVGEYVAKIMTEVKGRPRLIRSAMIRGGTTTELLPDGKAL
jgi:dolichol-phosphate mannosyltransferase